MNNLRYILVFLFLAIPGILLADDLSAIAFLIIFWPLDIVLCLMFIAMLVYCTRAISRRSAGKKQVIIGLILLTFSVAAGVLFPWLVSMNGAAQRHPGMMHVTVAPVIALAVLTAAASLIMAVKARGKVRD